MARTTDQMLAAARSGDAEAFAELDEILAAGGPLPTDWVPDHERDQDREVDDLSLGLPAGPAAAGNLPAGAATVLLQQDEDGAWCASAQLPGAGAVGDGATPEAALEDLRGALQALTAEAGRPDTPPRTPDGGSG